jgi:hypothetical protein
MRRQNAPCCYFQPRREDRQIAKRKENGRHIHAVRRQRMKSSCSIGFAPSGWVHFKTCHD